MTKQEWILIATAILAGYIAGGGWRAAAPVYAQERAWPKSVTAERFVTVDKNGAVRIEMAVDKTGGGTLRIFDEHGQVVFSIPNVGLLPAAASKR